GARIHAGSFGQDGFHHALHAEAVADDEGLVAVAAVRVEEVPPAGEGATLLKVLGPGIVGRAAGLDVELVLPRRDHELVEPAGRDLDHFLPVYAHGHFLLAAVIDVDPDVAVGTP